MHPSPIHRNISFATIFLTVLLLASCELRLQVPPAPDNQDLTKFQFEAIGEDYLVSALDEIQAIADWAESFTNASSRSVLSEASLSKKMTLAKTATDTVYIYGQIVAGGYGAVVTERYAYLKGMLLITVRKTYGKENGHVVTETNRYASHSDFLNDNPQQTNVTELFGRQKDTIVTYVLRNGRLETYTFRLPVITKVVSPQDGSVRVTTRYASGGAIVSKIDDGSGNLIQLRRSFGQADGSTVTRTEYPDYSWKQVRTIGQADGTIIRESTSGFSSFGSGFNTPIGRPPILNCRPETTHRSLASGVGTIKPPKIPFPLPPPPQCMISENVGKTCLKHEPCTRFLASGCGNRPPVLPPASAS